MKTIHRYVWLVIAPLLLGHQAGAQFYQPITFDPALLKFLDADSAFTASADFVTQADGKPDIMPLKIAILGSMTRVEMDITKEQGGKASDEVMAGYYKDLKTAGSAESVSIFNPARKCTYIILPRLRAYFEAPIPQQQVQELKQRPKVQKTEVGKDKLDGRACTKYALRFAANGPMDVWRTWESPSATVWIGQDTPAFPIRIEVLGSDAHTNCTLVIKDVRSGKVDVRLFEPPKGFTRCESQEALMKIIMDHWPASDGH
jgi:hypothetical protein